MDTRKYRNQRGSFAESNEDDALMATMGKRVSRRTVLQTGLGVAVTATGVGVWLGTHRSTTLAQNNVADNVVLQWNNAALQAIAATGTGPTIGARALAIAHTCMYDAWTVWDTVAVPTRPNGIVRIAKNKWKDVTEAVCYAAYRALLDLFPSQASTFTALLSNQGYDPNDTSTNTTTPSGIGNVAAQAVLNYRHGDGSNQLGDLQAGAYSDYTNYAPVNTPMKINDPNRWQPLQLANGTVQKFLTPQWGKVIPFALSSGSQFRPSGPATVTLPAYKSQVDATLQLSAGLNDTSKVIAEYWSDGPHTVTPPGHWDLFSQIISAQFVSHKNKHDINGDVKMFFAVTNAIFDASIACWDCKRAFDSVRPVTAIHYLYAGQQVTAWAGPGKGTQSFDGAKWASYLPTPAFSEYVSGHSTFSAAGGYILTQVVGSDTFGNSFTAAPGSSLVEPGITPSTSITLSWPSFTSSAVQAGMSRRYGGIHFQQADEDGRALGQKVATQAWTKAQTYINGTA